jgi:hypothetical protein
VTVTTDISGNASFSAVLSGVSVAAGDRVISTATLKSGAAYFETSEVSANVTATGDSAPVIVVPAAQAINEDTALSINSISVTDAEGNLSTVQLSVTQGTLSLDLSGGATLSGGANASASLTLSGSQAQINSALASLSYQGALDFNGADSLTVLATDALGYSSSNTVALTVNAVNDAPVITSNGGGNTANVNVAENTVAVTSVTSTDVDGGTPVYSVGGADAARFNINASTGVLSFVTAPNFEAPTDADGNNIYNVTVQVFDGSLTSSQAVAVTVTNVNEAPSGSNATLSTAENTALVFNTGHFGFTDVDAGDSLSAVRIDALPLAGSLTLNGAAVNAGDLVSAAQLAAGSLVFTPALNANGAAYASFNFSVRDQGNVFDTTQRTLTVDLTAVNDAPVLTQNQLAIDEGASQVITAANLAATDTDNAAAALVFTVSGVQHGRFEYVATPGTAITSFSQAEVSGALVRFVHDGGEWAAAYSVSASDGSLSSAPAAASITFNKVNDAPTNSPVTLTAILEDSGARLITQAELLVNALDVDSANLSVTGLTITAGAGTLVDNGNGSWTYTPALNDNTSVNFSYSVSDGSLTVAGSAALDITPVSDAPVITSNGGGSTAVMLLDENTVSVTTVQATNPDLTGPAVRYTISGGADAARFSIDAVTGALSFVTAPDFEAPTNAAADNTYRVSVQASNGLLNAQQTLSVVVANVNEAPRLISAVAATLSVNAAAGTLVATAAAADPDAGDSLRYALTNDAGGRFVIDAVNGRIVVAAGAVFDLQQASGFNLGVRVTDAKGLSFEHSLRINLGAAPAAENPTPTPTDAATLPVTVTAPPPLATTPEPKPVVALVDEAAQAKPASDARSPAATTVSGDPAAPFAPVLQPISTEFDARISVASGRARRDESLPAIKTERLVTPDTAWLAAVNFDSLDTSLSVADNSASAGSQTSLMTSNGSRSSALGKHLEEVEVDTASSAQAEAASRSGAVWGNVVLTPARITSVTFSAGFIWWLTRSGGLLTSMLIGVPAWRHIDLLPVLARDFDDEEEEDGLEPALPRGRVGQPTDDDAKAATSNAATDAAVAADNQLEGLFDRGPHLHNDTKSDTRTRR